MFKLGSKVRMYTNSKGDIYAFDSDDGLDFKEVGVVLKSDEDHILADPGMTKLSNGEYVFVFKKLKKKQRHRGHRGQKGSQQRMQNREMRKNNFQNDQQR